MEIKIDIIGDESKLTTFLHGLTINHSQKTEKTVKTATTKKKGRPKKTAAPKPEPEPELPDDILDDPDMADIGAHIFGTEDDAR